MGESCKGREQRRQGRAIFDPISHQLGTYASESWAHRHTEKWRPCSKLGCNHFKCRCPAATDLCSILLKNALARDFFSWAHNFKASSQYPCGHSLVRAGDSWKQGRYNSIQIPFHFTLPRPTIPACLLCSFRVATQLPLEGISICGPIEDAWDHPLWEAKRMRSHA